MHVLMHVRLDPDGTSRTSSWAGTLASGEVDVTTANHRTRWKRNGKRLPAIGYIAKQMTPQARYPRDLVRKPGGPIIGKRGGVTKNIGWRAQAEFRGRLRHSPFHSDPRHRSSG